MTHSTVLSGKVALVTGSSRGIGFTLAAGLAGAGATVVINGNNADRVEAAKSKLAEQFGQDRIHAAAFNVTSEHDVVAGLAGIEANVGPLHILVNNAGIQHRSSLLDLELADWNRVVDTNLTGAFLVGREAARHMTKRQRGKIINICSIQADLARPTIAPYVAAKGGLRNLTRSMTAEWAASGLQINGIAPGYIHTEMTQSLVDDEAFNKWILARTPANRWGRVEDIVGPALWLASEGADFVNGQTIFVDGGMSVVV
ncbi:SDR family oxidoreductase [Arthrobacter sp. 18067]|uniref:SDR family oxidoreductase n=1 Tax=Arthrobacter sp. 18067 TaxID=2681413 RepID=UPI00135AED83|nr:SDR family oxidoreductase [Arthrobacter sp. 18067]